MTDRIEELSDRARWFLNNFDEIDLADICASYEHNSKIAATDETLARARAEVARWKRNTLEPQTARALDDIDRALNPPAHDAGPTVAECAANDRRWPLEKAGE